MLIFDPYVGSTPTAPQTPSTGLKRNIMGAAGAEFNP